MERAAKVALASVFVGSAVLALKLAAAWLTGSVALFSDALESIINVVAAGAAFIALQIAARPPDANHPYGHHKAEYFSAVFEGVLVVIAALSIFREAYLGFLDPKPIAAVPLGLAVNGAATVLNLAWAMFLIRSGRRWRSPALVADGWHVMADVFTSIAVIGGIALVTLTGWLVLDSLLAAFVALNVLWTGWRITRVSVGGLMDEVPSPEIVDQVKAVISKHASGAIEAHDVRTRHAGRASFVEFHLVVPGDMLVSEAHDICDRIETALKHDMGEGATITIHVEPEAKAKHKGVLVL